MVACACVFPGQGAQYIGMGKALCDSFPEAKEIFEKGNELLGFSLSRLCFEGPLEALTRTQNSQPAIFTASCAALAVLTHHQQDYKILANCGLSLGEYTALVASGVFSFEDGLHAVSVRGRLMEEASSKYRGTLAAIFGLNLAKVKELCKKTGTELANLNCPGQIVVSGLLADIEKIVALSKEAGAKRVIPLEVSGPFHSRFMKEAGQGLEQVLKTLSFQKPKTPFVSNVTGHFAEEPAAIQENLVKQVSGTVLWEDSIQFLISRGIRHFVEVGPGKVLSGLIRKIDATVEISHMESPEELVNR